MCMAYVIFQQDLTGTELVLKGSITGSISRNLIPLVQDNLKSEVSHVVIDMNECQLLTSDVLNSLCQLQKVLSNKNIPIALVNLNGVNKKIYNRMNLQEILPIKESSS